MRPSTCRRLFALSLLFTLAPLASAQDAALNASQVGKYSNPNPGSIEFADMWAEGNYAVVGRFGTAFVDIIDISTPSSPVLDNTYSIGSPNNLKSAQDVKVGDDLLFISLEVGSGSGNDGVEVVDFRDPTSPSKLINIDVASNLSDIHNTFYDNGWLYICNSSDTEMAVIDLTGFDPDSPGSDITSFDYNLFVGNVFIHDITVENGRLWVSAWGSTEVFDVSNIGASAPSFMGSTRGLSAHANWPTADGNYVISTEERLGGGIRLYEVDDNGSTVTFMQRDSWTNPNTGPSGNTYSPHNPVVMGDRVYVSNYSAGVICLQIDTTNHTFEKVASFDTSTAANNFFFGGWGVYPFLGEDNVLVSDIEEGMVVVDMSALQIETTSARPLTIDPDTDTEMEILITELGGRTLDSGTVVMWTSVDGGPYSADPMSDDGGGLFTTDFPSAAFGSRIDYYFEGDDTFSNTFTRPANAPTDVFTTYVASGLNNVFTDTFTSNMGWTTSSSGGGSTGLWERGTSNESPAAPDEDDPDDAGTSCYFTDQGSVGGSGGEADIDDLSVTLTSPNMDFSGGDGLVSYSRWFFQDDTDSNDSFLVEVRNGGAWMTVEEVFLKSGGWVKQSFRVSDHVTPNSTVQVRFTANDDNAEPSVVEAAIDTVTADVFQRQATSLVRNGAGGNPLCFSSVSLAELGSTFEVSISHDVTAFLTYILGYDTASSGNFITEGEILVDQVSNLMFVSAIGSAGTSDLHQSAIPNDPSLIDVFVAMQGLSFEPTQFILCNALDVTVGN